MMKKPVIENILWTGIIAFVASIIFSTVAVQAIVILLTTVWAWHALSARPLFFTRTAFDAPYLLFVAARILSVPFSVNLSESVKGLYTEVVYYGIFFVITNEFKIDVKNRLRTALWVLFASAAMASVYGSVRFLLGNLDRATSTVSGPVTLGMYLTAVLALGLFLGADKQFFPKRWIWYVWSFVVGVGIICTLNRIHWGLAALAVVIAGIRRERRLLLLLSILAIAGILLLPRVSERLVAPWTDVNRFLTERDVIWKTAVPHLLARPITGFGLKTFHDVFTSNDLVKDKEIGSWHNDYLQVYMESGVIALGAFLWLVAAIFTRGSGAYKHSPPGSPHKELILALLVSMGMFFGAAFVGGFVIDPLTSFLFRFELALLALLVSSTQAARSTSSTGASG